MRNDDTVDNLGEIGTEEGEIGESSLIIVSHVHPTVKHDIPSTHPHHHTTTTHILTRSQAQQLNHNTRHPCHSLLSVNKA